MATEATQKQAQKPDVVRIHMVRPQGEEHPGHLVMVNGLSVTVPYDKDVTVPRAVFHALDDAKTSATRRVKTPDGYKDEPYEINRFKIVVL